MASNSVPGPLGIATTTSLVDQGTLCVAQSPSPGPLLQPTRSYDQSMQQGLAQLMAQVQRFASQHIQVTLLHDSYLTEVERCLLPILASSDSSQITTKDAQNLINALRDELLSMEQLVGGGTVPAFYKLLSLIKSYGGSATEELVAPDFTKRRDSEKQRICINIINMLSPNNLALEGVLGLRTIQSWVRFITACLVWAKEAERMQAVFSWQPQIRRSTSYQATRRTPAASPSPSRMPPPSPSQPVVEEEPFENIDQDQQAATLEAAAKDGTPFCEECEKARRREETLGHVDQDQQAATLETAAKDGTPFCEECEKASHSRGAASRSAA